MEHGLGLHYQALDTEYSRLVYNFNLNLYVGQLVCSTTVFCAKLAILAFYWRIFNVTSIRWPIRILVVVIVCCFISRVMLLPSASI